MAARRTLVAAIESIRARGRKAPLSLETEGIIASMLADAGRVDEARALAERIGRHSGSNLDANYGLARAWAILGDRVRSTSPRGSLRPYAPSAGAEPS